MWGHAYFAARYFAQSYWPQSLGNTPIAGAGEWIVRARRRGRR
jgi:hypothetical protein